MGHTLEADLVRRFYGKAWNRWDDTVVDELLAEGFAFRGSLGDEVHGRSGWRAYRDAVRSAIPDFHNEIVELIVAPGQAAARLRYTGHHQGVLLANRAAGRRSSMRGRPSFAAPMGASRLRGSSATSTGSAGRSTRASPGRDRPDHIALIDWDLCGAGGTR
jgi:predicted ester cyclase